MYIPELTASLKGTLDDDLFDIFEKQIGQVDDDDMLVLTLLRVQDSRSARKQAEALEEIRNGMASCIDGDWFFHVRQK